MSLLWLLPLLFLVHDAEEALFLKPWLVRNRAWLARCFPKLARRLLPHFEQVSGGAFVWMAAEELLLLTGVTLYSFLSGNLYPWLALFLAFALHLIIHLMQWLAVGRYIPSAVTSVLCLPVCIYIVCTLVDAPIFSVRDLLLCGVAGIAGAGVNLLLIHRLASRLMRKGVSGSPLA